MADEPNDDHIRALHETVARLEAAMAASAERPSREPLRDRLARLEQRVRELGADIKALRAEIRTGRPKR